MPRGSARCASSGRGSLRRLRCATAALLSFAVAAVAGLVLALLTTLLLVPLGLVLFAAAWGYTGGRSPYGYRGLGEVSVFVFFGLVAVVGTTYVQAERLTAAAVLGGIGCGALACAILVTNNLRDIPTDTVAGKRTLAVRLGDPRTRTLYLGLLAAAAVVVVVLAAVTPWALLALLSVPLALGPLRVVRSGADRARPGAGPGRHRQAAAGLRRPARHRPRPRRLRPDPRDRRARPAQWTHDPRHPRQAPRRRRCDVR